MNRNNRGQTTIFIVIAILIVAVVALFFLLRNDVDVENLPSEFQPHYDDFSVCIRDELDSGIRVLQSQGGYIYLPEFERGSEYMPFSSQLNFLGNPVPYWYYVSGNNFQRENVPSFDSMEEELERFVESQATGCVPEGFEGSFEIEAGEPEANVDIRENEVILNLDMDFNFLGEEATSRIDSHDVIVNSELGNLYQNALNIYETEQEEMFLEEYAVDTLRLYAPVDGIDISCSPKIWSADEVFGELQVAIEENTNSLKAIPSGEDGREDYFFIDSLENRISSDVRVNFLNSQNWPSTLEVNPSEGFLMRADPVGNQEGMGALGFCYVPYHFVYDVKYPVMIQVHSRTTEEIFQFPFAIVIEGNTPREALNGSASSSFEGAEICENEITEFRVRTINQDSQEVDADIFFECFSESCPLGSSEGEFNGLVPQCANAFIRAEAEGYKDAEVSTSTVNQGSIDIILEREYEMEVQLNIDSSIYSGESLITFENSEGEIKTLYYPEQGSVNLSEGTYEVSARVYENASVNVVENVQEYCVDIPRTFGGNFGLTREECFDITVPDQIISSALAGGGTGEIYMSESDLSNSGQILINAESLPEPDSLDRIQQNDILFDSKELEVILR